MQPYAGNSNIKLEIVEAEIVVVLLRFQNQRVKYKTRGLILKLCMQKLREAETSRVVLTLKVKTGVPPTGTILP